MHTAEHRILACRLPQFRCRSPACWWHEAHDARHNHWAQFITSKWITLSTQVLSTPESNYKFQCCSHTVLGAHIHNCWSQRPHLTSRSPCSPPYWVHPVEAYNHHHKHNLPPSKGVDYPPYQNLQMWYRQTQSQWRSPLLLVLQCHRSRRWEVSPKHSEYVSQR